LVEKKDFLWEAQMAEQAQAEPKVSVLRSAFAILATGLVRSGLEQAQHQRRYGKRCQNNDPPDHGSLSHIQVLKQ